MPRSETASFYMIIWHRYDIRYYKIMSTTKVAITIDRRLLGRLDAR